MHALFLRPVSSFDCIGVSSEIGVQQRETKSELKKPAAAAAVSCHSPPPAGAAYAPASVFKLAAVSDHAALGSRPVLVAPLK